MNISRDEAAAALAEIDGATGQIRERRSYHVSGPILMVWGVAWAVGYSGMGLLPEPQWGWVWLAVNTLGVIATIVIAGRASGKSASASPGSWRMFAMMASILAFVAAVLNLFGTENLNAVIAFPGVLAGMIYALVGIWGPRRYLWVGVAVFAASLVGYFAFPDILAFWMAAVGGGGLFLGGIWMRSA